MNSIVEAGHSLADRSVLHGSDAKARRASGRRAWGVDPALVSLIAGLAAPTDLLAALERSKAEGVNLAQAYLADFPDAEERLYRAVGRALEIKFVDWAPAAPGFDAGAVMQAGLCPLDGEGRLTLLLAPPAERLGALLSRNPRPPPGRAFMTTPSRFRDLVLSRLEARGQACDWLRGFDPELSVGPMGREAKLAVSLRLSLLVLACVLPQAPWLVSAWPFCAATAIKLFATASSASRSPQERLQADQDLPIYSVLVPLYREARVVRQILESLSALDYPGIMAQTPQAPVISPIWEGPQ